MKIYAIVILSVITTQIMAQNKTDHNKIFSVIELQEDFQVFKKAIETTYPSLYRYTDSLAMQKYLNQQFNKLKEPLTELDFYKKITLASANANDEHLIPSPSKEYYQYLKSASHYLPFSLKIINRRFFVLKKHNLGNTLPVGAEILSINGRSVEEILNILTPTIPSDGYIQSFNYRHLEDYSMTQNENLFDLNYPIFIEDTNTFKIEFIHPSQKTHKIMATISGLDYTTYQKFYEQRIGYKAPLEFKKLENNVAYLRISSFLKWHRNDFKQDFNQLYESIFQNLNQTKTKYLILDLRNNEGGDGSGEKLIKYLITKPYTHYSYTEEQFVGYPPVDEYLEKSKNLYFADSLVYKTKTGKYRLKQEHFSNLYKIQPPAKNNFKGEIYVLQNGGTGSMASIVCTFLKENKRAIFIGEESGGTMEGNTSDSYIRLRLPNTKIQVEIPLTEKVNNVNFTKGRGVIPDYNIVPSIDDLIIGIDTELNFVINLIKSKK